MTVYQGDMTAEHYRKERDKAIRERDEARAEAKKAKQDYDDLYELDEQTWVAEAEQRGYRRGVQDAIAAGDKMAQDGTYGWVWLRAAILALLEQIGEPGEKR